jgi:hypothetical protein
LTDIHVVANLADLSGGAKIPYAQANGSGKYLKLLVSWEGIPKLMFRNAIKV